MAGMVRSVLPLALLAKIGQGATTYTYTTSNSEAYMCPSGTSTTGRTLVCGQGEYPAGANEGVTATVACSSGTIECFLFASFGEVGGSCAGDAFKENPNNQWAYMPASVGNACKGTASCAITAGSGTLNDVAVTWQSSAPTTMKFKAVAMCSADSAATTAASGGAAAPAPAAAATTTAAAAGTTAGAAGTTAAAGGTTTVASTSAAGRYASHGLALMGLTAAAAAL